MVYIIFESHSTTVDNELGIASGWDDVELSDLGKVQALELGKRYSNQVFDAIFCSDLQRSYRTAQIAFPNGVIIPDKRLRECHYGTFTRQKVEKINEIKLQHLVDPFPDGESYEHVMIRMKDFLEDIFQTYSNKRIMIIGHRATQYGLEHFINKVPLKTTVMSPWKWQPGWEYHGNNA